LSVTVTVTALHTLQQKIVLRGVMQCVGLSSASIGTAGD